MTPKEKAKELVDRYLNIQDSIGFNSHNLMYLKEAKQCVLICVDEILQTIPKEVMSYKPFMMNTDYWQEVKEEIKEL